MHDLIERQAAIDTLMPIYKSASLRNRNVFSTARKCMSAIEELPSAQPDLEEAYICGETEAEARYHAERKKGKWINVRHDNIAECDQCGITGRAWMNFCPICGARMEGES